MIGFAETLLPYWKPLAVLAAVGAGLAARRLWPAQVGLVAGWIGRAWRVAMRLFGLAVRLALVVALSVAAAWWAAPAVEVDGETMSRARYAVALAREARGWEGECWELTLTSAVLLAAWVQAPTALEVLSAWLFPGGRLTPEKDGFAMRRLTGPEWRLVPKHLTWEDRPLEIWWDNTTLLMRDFLRDLVPALARWHGCQVPGGAEAMIQFLGVEP